MKEFRSAVGADMLDISGIDRKIGFNRSNSCKLYCSVDLPAILRGMIDFMGIKKETFECILDIAHIKNYDKNTIICYKDDEVDTLLYLFHGSIKAFKNNKYDKEAIVNLYVSECAMQNEPPLINYDSFADNIARNTLQTLEPCRILSVQSEAFKELLKSDIVLANNLINRANFVLNELNYFIELSLMDSKAKVIALMQRYPNILKNVSKKLIASLLNISQETLSRTLQSIYGVKI